MYMVSLLAVLVEHVLLNIRLILLACKACLQPIGPLLLGSFLPFILYFGATPVGTQGLLLALHSEVISDGAQETIWDARE